MSNKKTSKTNPVVYFSVPISRLVTFSILSMGIYEIYWAYKNWEAIKKSSDKKIYPILRSWFFNIFFIIPLIYKIIKDIKKSSAKIIGLIAASIGYLFFYYMQVCFDLLLAGADTPLTYMVIFALSFSSLIFGIIFLITLQKKINGHNQKINKKYIPNIKASKGEWIVLAASVILTALSLTVSFLEIQNLKKKMSLVNDEQIGTVIGAAYRHIIAYDEACSNYGYSLVKYPEEFVRNYKRQLEKTSLKLMKENLTILESWLLIDPEILNELSQHVERELENLRQSIILQTVAEELKIPAKNIAWSAEYNDKLSIAETCKILDDNAEYIILSNKKLINLFKNK
jgi:hypothetical protein